MTTLRTSGSLRPLDFPTLRILVVLPSVAFLVALSFYNYLLFHSLVELFSVVVAALIFVLARTTQNFMANHYFLFLGISYFYVGLIDLVHTLAYKGMGVFQDATVNEPTQLWILARYIESASLLTAPTYARRKAPVVLVGMLYTAVTFVGLLAVFQWKVFPDCFVEGKGLTPFKIVSEYVICVVLLAGAIRLYGVRTILDTKIFRLLLAAVVTTVLAELSFTFYVHVYGLSNMAGHLFKLLSFLFVFEAIVVTGIRDPFAILFREIKENEKNLREEKEKLEAALKEIKTLQGLLPMCSYCKKIRDDQGDWHSVETYIRAHTNATFSHGICPDCLRRYFPDMAEDVLRGLESQKPPVKK